MDSLRKKTKILILSAIMIFIFSQIGFWGIFVKEGRTQGVVSVPAVEAGLGTRIAQAIDEKVTALTNVNVEKVLDRLFKSLVRTASVQLKNTLVQIAQNAANNAVDYLATGNWGQRPMFEQRTFAKYKDDVVSSVINETLDSLSGELWKNLNFDICDPDFEVKMLIQKDIANQKCKPGQKCPGKTGPRCNYKAISGNWDDFISQVQNTAGDALDATYAALGAVSLNYNPGENDFGAFMKIRDDVLSAAADEYAAQKDDRMITTEIESPKSLVDRVVLTPKSTLQKTTEGSLEKAQAAQTDELKAAGDVITEIPEAVLSVFISKSFAKRMATALFKRVLTGLVKKSESYNPQQQVYEYQKSSEKVSKEVLSVGVDFSYEPRDISTVDQFVNCPQESTPGIPRGVSDCVMDLNFAEAVKRADTDTPLTVAEAVEQGLLKGSKPFYGPGDEENTNVSCYKEGYCYNNLKKLRAARILPIGWEIAAEKTADYGNQTLNELMAAFDEPNSPWYRLVDPNWVLKEPLTQCRAEVSGPDLIGSGTSTRSDVCADYRTCVDETPGGECLGGYGYCAEEKRTWRLEGDTCEAQFADCATLQDRNGGKQSWILNTLDPLGCSPSSVGCKQYSLWKDAGSWVASTLSEHVAADYSSWIFLNKNSENDTCAPSSEGCSRFINTSPEIGTNLIKNSSFEDTFSVLNGTSVYEWQSDEVLGVIGVFPVSTEVSNSGNNSAFVKKDDSVPGQPPKYTPIYTSSNGFTGSAINVVEKDYYRYYILNSFANKVATETELICSLQVTSSATVGSTTSWTTLESFNSSATASQTVSGIWNRYYWLFRMEPEIGGDAIKNMRVNCHARGGDAYFDDLQLEEVLDPTSAAAYTPYGATNAVYLKKAPDYYNCYDGNPNTSHANCANFAHMCEAQDVGCETFTPTDGGDAVNSVVGRENYCPAECNGYQTFYQEGTFFEPDKFPVYFIPSTATSCSAENVGCQAYTNLDALASGAESVYYFKSIKQCSKPDDVKCAVFYTWTGSDVSGYQIQNHSLVDAKKDGQPDMTIQATQDCDEAEYNAQTNPDCRQFYGASQAGATIISYHLISKTITCSEDCHPFRLDVDYEVDARDEAQTQCSGTGGTWDSLTNRCIYNIIPSEAISCPTQEAGCREYRGNVAGDIQVLLNQDFEGTNFDSADWSGAGSLSSEALNLSGHSFNVTKNSFTQQTVRYEVVSSTDEPVYTLEPGSRYTLSFWLKPNTADVDNDQVNSLQDLLDYEVAIGVGNTTVRTSLESLDWQSYGIIIDPTAPIDLYQMTFENAVKPKQPNPGTMGYYIDNIKVTKIQDVEYLIKNSWSTPQSCDLRLDTIDESLPQAMLGCREYRDRAGNLNYLRSFNNFCDSSVVGCRSLIDTKNSATYQSKIYNKEGLDLCADSVVRSIEVKRTVSGDICKNRMVNMLCDTQSCADGYETDDSQLEKNVCNQLQAVSNMDAQWEDGVGCVPSSSLDWYQVAADDYIYLVNSQQYQCSAQDKGCTAVGQALFNTDEAIVDWAQTYLKIDPDNLDNKICKNSELNCEQYVDSSKNVYYFKNPGIKYCVYQPGPYGDAWYEAGSDPLVLCDTIDLYGDGNKKVLPYYYTGYVNTPLYGASETLGWSAQCPNNQNTCAAFIDPADKADNPIGKTYYYKNNDKIDRDSCNGVVNPLEGCMLFQDMSKDELSTWSADATYLEASSLGRGVDPIVIKPEKQTDLRRLIDEHSSEDLSQATTVVKASVAQGSGQNISGLVDISERFNSFEAGQYVALIDHDNDPNTDAYTMFNDSNQVLKVVQDRQCSRWYTCIGPSMVWDENKSNWTQVCEYIGLCSQYEREGGAAYCSKVVVEGVEDSSPMSQKDYFTADDYISRHSLKFDFLDKYYDLYTPEYAGLAIPDYYPTQFIKPVNIEKNVSQLTDDYYILAVPDGVACSEDTACGAKGLCVGGQCYQPKSNKENLRTQDITSLPDSKSCRAYPRENTPFPASAVFKTISNIDEKVSEERWEKYRYAEYFGFDLLNDMNETERKTDYGCNYKDYTYGGKRVTIHLPLSKAAPQRICEDSHLECECATGEDLTKAYCTNSDCPGGDSCLKQDLSISTIYGWEGYCLETDESIGLYNDDKRNPCLSWYPLDLAAGLSDYFNQYVTAGYNSGDQPFYCLTARPYLQEKAYFSDGGYLGGTYSWGAAGDYGNCNSQGTGNKEVWTVKMRDIIDEAVDSPTTDAQTPDEKLFAIAEEFGNFFSNSEVIINGFDTPTGSIDLHVGGDRLEVHRSLVSYYITNVDGNESKSSCPEGYFPVFAPCGAWQDYPGYEYSTSNEERSGVICVPFNSEIQISTDEAAKWQSSYGINNIMDLNGAECKPHFTRGAQLVAKNVRQESSSGSNSWNNACFDNSASNGITGLCSVANDTRVDTVYDLVTAVDFGFNVSYPTAVANPGELEDSAEPWPNYSNKKETITNYLFQLSRSQMGTNGYFWDLRNKTVVLDSDKTALDEYKDGVKINEIWNIADAEHGWQNKNFDFLVPLYRYCVQKTPIIDNYLVLANSQANGASGPVGIADYIETYLHEWQVPSNQTGNAITSIERLTEAAAKDEVYLAEGKMLCDQLGEFEDNFGNDKAWTDQLYKYQNMDVYSKQINGLSPSDSDFAFYYGTLPDQYGQALVDRKMDTEQFVEVSSCSYSAAGQNNIKSLTYLQVAPPSMQTPSGPGTDAYCDP
ncbi:MAG TPA: hypothetical protein VMX18_04935, partial [Candidatus Bipolaricaulota bacterium]|nr:hypothetical protein [Candidatus Bipolaricaulota bacterium]